MKALKKLFYKKKIEYDSDMDTTLYNGQPKEKFFDFHLLEPEFYTVNEFGRVEMERIVDNRKEIIDAQKYMNSDDLAEFARLLSFKDVHDAHQRAIHVTESNDNFTKMCEMIKKDSFGKVKQKTVRWLDT